jgi:gliding motility-associated-like protein
MGIVFFNNNKLRGKIFNGISQFPNLEKIRLQDNSLTFGSLIPISQYLNNNDAIYSPQAKFYPDTILIGEISKSLKIDLKIDTGELENIYQWNKNGNPYVTVKSKNYIEFQSLQISDTGIYSVNVTNPNLPKLSLKSGNIKLKVPCSIIQTSKSDTLCKGKSIQFGNQILTKGGIYQEKFISNVGCDSIVTLNLVESNLATVPVTFIEDCQLVANVDISGGNKPFKYLWNTGQTSEIIRGLQSNFNYSLTVTDIKGCSSTGMIKTPLLDKFNVIPSIKIPDCGLKNGEIKLSISGTPPYQIVWKAGTPGLGDSLRTDLVSGTYSLFVRDANNCYDSLTLVMDQSLNCEKNYKIFSSFSPNGDGINEYFIIKPISCEFNNLETCFPKNELIIFNRWSDPIFKSSPYNNDWDGERYPEGTYFFIFKSGEDNVIEKGFITLIRRI